MRCIADIITLAEGKLLDAECLVNGHRHDGAFYLAGYTVELYLKAKICRTLGIENFFDFEDDSRKRQFKTDGRINQAYKLHDLESLLVLSGVYSQFEVATTADPSLQTAWSLLAEEWNESKRYVSGKTHQQAADLIKAVKIFELWIRSYL